MQNYHPFKLKVHNFWVLYAVAQSSQMSTVLFKNSGIVKYFVEGRSTILYKSTLQLNFLAVSLSTRFNFYLCFLIFITQMVLLR